MDWMGAVTLFVSVVSLMLLCTEIAKDQNVTDVKGAYAAVFAVATITFLFYESRCGKPLLDLTIFSNGKFTLPILSAFLLYTAISLATTLAPFYFQGAMGYTASEVGYISMVVPLFMMFAAPASGGIYDKRHWKYQAAAGPDRLRSGDDRDELRGPGHELLDDHFRLRHPGHRRRHLQQP